MPNQTTALALTPPAEALHEPEYQALVSALSESARGRAFLAEHARRARGAETSGLLAALDRIEALVRAQGTQAVAHPPRMELQALLDDLRAARPMVEMSPLPAKAAQLAALLDLLTSQLADVLASASGAIELTDSAPEQAAIPHAGEPPRARWTDAPPDALVFEADALPSELSPPASGSADKSEAFAFIMALSEEERIALFT